MRIYKSSNLLSDFTRLIFPFLISIACASIALAATYTVTKTADTNDGSCSSTDCSLREAIAAANSTSANDTINFNIPTSDPGCSGGVCTITLSSSSGQLVINSALTAGTLTITNSSGTRKIEISGNNSIRILDIATNGNLVIDNLTLRNGRADFGGCIRNDGTLLLTNTIISNCKATRAGGGFRNLAIATIIDSIIINNSSSDNNDDGGGISNAAGSTLTIINSTISNNTADDKGGGIRNFNATLYLINSTVSNNQGGTGGGVMNENGASLFLINSTISNNTATNRGGGIRNSASVTARNSLIANNTALNPDFDGTLTSQGHNLISNTTGTTITGTTTGNILNQDPRLSPLGYYGGKTPTRALLSNSPAINAGNNCVTTANGCGPNDPIVAVNNDQRGASRTDSGRGSAVDIGAYETNSAYIAFLPSATLVTPYNFTITANNESCTMNMSGLPSGLVLSSFGTSYTITGIPTQTGNFSPSLTVNCAGQTTTINYSLFVAAPTAASVSISGRVFGGSGKGLRNAYVILTDEQGRSRTVQTSAFGYYRFEEVEVGRTYILTVQSKRYEFEPQVVFVTDEITELNFYPVEYRKGVLDRFNSSSEGK